MEITINTVNEFCSWVLIAAGTFSIGVFILFLVKFVKDDEDWIYDKGFAFLKWLYFAVGVGVVAVFPYAWSCVALRAENEKKEIFDTLVNNKDEDVIVTRRLERLNQEDLTELIKKAKELGYAVKFEARPFIIFYKQ